MSATHLVPCRSLLLSHSVLLPGGDGPAPQGVNAARQGGRLSGLVPLSGAHLLTAPHDGGRAARVGGTQPQSELLPHDRLPGGIERDPAPDLCPVFNS